MRVMLCFGLLTALPSNGFFTTSVYHARSPCSRRPLDHQSSFLVQHSAADSQIRSPWLRPGALVMAKEGPGFAKTLAAVVIIGTTVGASTVPFLLQGSKNQSPRTVRITDEDGRETERGVMTSMTRPEIQKKLSQIPVFFLRDENGAVHVEQGEGLFFMSPEDAQGKLKELKDVQGTKVAATTLDDVWFPLIRKKGLNKKPVSAQASISSDLSARYRIVPRGSQLAQAAQTEGWSQEKDKGGVPVWAAKNLAFQSSGSNYKVPLFTNLDDLMSSWERLQSEGSESNQPTIQVSSIGAIVDLMESGGGENRKLEFFADMEAIGQAEKLM